VKITKCPGAGLYADAKESTGDYSEFAWLHPMTKRCFVIGLTYNEIGVQKSLPWIEVMIA
jgi:hypothetical protein